MDRHNWVLYKSIYIHITFKIKNIQISVPLLNFVISSTHCGHRIYIFINIKKQRNFYWLQSCIIWNITVWIVIYSLCLQFIDPRTRQQISFDFCLVWLRGRLHSFAGVTVKAGYPVSLSDTKTFSPAASLSRLRPSTTALEKWGSIFKPLKTIFSFIDYSNYCTSAFSQKL